MSRVYPAMNSSLIRSLMKSDFFFLEAIYAKQVGVIQSGFKVDELYSCYQLEIFEILKSFKQFIRILQYSKTKGASLTVWANSNERYFILGNILSKLAEPSITLLPDFSKKFSRQRSLKPLLVLGPPQDQTGFNFFRFLRRNNLMLVQQINSIVDFKNRGDYKIYNNVTDFKKVVYIGVLLNKVFT